uniref:CSON000350 protein n=1 Tax=Culicoides sonorensis TaxID=179676 RepID=A0A336MEF0_CULSO
MTGISKIFYEISNGKTCRDLHHAHIKSCRTHFYNLLWTLLPGGFKLYVPLLVIPPLLKGKQLTWKYLQKHIWEYINISLKTYIQAVAALGSVCLLYKIFGKLHFYTVMAIPGMISALVAPKMIHSHLRLQSITFFNMMLEVLIKKSNISMIQFLKNSRVFGTAMFMIMSGIIMNILQKSSINQFWLISPTKVKSLIHEISDLNSNFEKKLIDNRKFCSHEEPCFNYIKDGIFKYTIAGLILEVSKSIISRFPLLLQEPLKFCVKILKGLSFRLPLFLASYVGIFRMTSCILSNFKKGDQPEFSKIAGNISGIAFYIYPKYQIFTLAFTKSIEMSWNYSFDLMNKNNCVYRCMKSINDLPILWMMRFIALGVMYHTALFYPHLSPAFNHKAFNFCSNNAVKTMKSSLISWMLATVN